MDLQFISLLSLQGLMISAVIALGAGIWALSREHRPVHDLPVAFLLVSVSIWVFAHVLWRSADVASQAQFWLRSLYLIGSFIPAAFLMFALTTLLRRPLTAPVQSALLAPSLAAYVLVYHTDAVLARSEVVMTPAAGFWMFALAAHFFTYAVAGLVVLFIASRRGHLTRQNSPIMIIAGGIATMSPVGIFLYFYVPFFAATMPIAVPFLVLIGVFLVGFTAMRQAGRVDPSSFGLEVLVFLALFVLTTDTVSTASDEYEFALRLVILVLLVVFGAMMTRVHAKEMSRLRNIAAMHDVLAKMNAKLIDADRIKTKFVAFASHQLRAPIGGIRGYLDMLRSGDFGKLTEQQADVIEKNLEALSRLTLTIKSFLDVTKIEFGKFEAFKTEEHIDEVIARAVNDVRPAAFKKGLTLETKVGQGLPSVHIDAGKIHNALVNLVDNAIKYTEKGFIIVRAERKGRELVVTVEDTGVGLTKKDLERIGHLLQSGISAVKLESSGEGLGLYIVKNIVEAHGGRLILDSEGRGKGSRIGLALMIDG